jgi:hypothetical protein
MKKEIISSVLITLGIILLGVLMGLILLGI